MVKSNYSYISGQKLIKILNKHFWKVKIISQKWSHIKVKFNNIVTIIPDHKELAYGTFHNILKQINIDEEKFIKFL